MNSCIYEGRVRHARYRPVARSFSYRLFLMYLDLDELPTLFEGRWFWSTRRAAIARFRREHHLGDPTRPLGECVRDLVERDTGRRPRGPIRLLTNLSYFGYCFNPVSFYYCYGEDGQRLEAIVAEVNNTPWGEQHCYVLPQRMNAGKNGHGRYFPEKVMHVSPFMEMDVDYDWRFNAPGQALTVHMENARRGRKMFDATLVLEREEINGRALARALTVYPLMTLRVVAAIYWQALKLWLKGTPLHDHPGKGRPAAEEPG